MQIKKQLDENIDLFNQATLSVGTSGQGRLRRTIDPENPVLRIEHADQFGRIDAIPLARRGDLAIVSRGQQQARTGLAAKMEHYAKNKGGIFLDGKHFTLIGFDPHAREVTVQRGDYSKIVKLNELRDGVRFDHVEPAWKNIASASMQYDLANVEGDDALALIADVGASADVSYQLLVKDGSEQKEIHAQLVPEVDVLNNTEADMKDLALELKLNDLPQRRPQPMRAKRASLEMAAMADDSDSMQMREGAVSGVITMPLLREGLNVQANASRSVNFSDALLGEDQKTTEKALHVPVTLEQKLNSTLYVPLHNKAGDSNKVEKQHPSSSFELSGTETHRPAGDYRLFEGSDVAANTTAHKYTPKGETLTLQGGEQQNIKFEGLFETRRIDHGQPKLVPELSVPHRNSKEKRDVYERQDRHSMAFKATFESTSEYDREIEFKLQVGNFDAGVENIGVTIFGLRATYKYDELDGTITFKVPASPTGKTDVEVAFDGKRTQQIFQ